MRGLTTVSYTHLIGDTVAMSKPHEIEYKITFLSDTIKAVE